MARTPLLESCGEVTPGHEVAEPAEKPVDEAEKEAAAAAAAAVEEEEEEEAQRAEAAERQPDAGVPGDAAGGVEGLRPLQWANCEVLQQVLNEVLPDCELAPQRVVLLDVSMAQLVKLGDYDQVCEALINGPQCADMRARLEAAELVLALVNDNDDASVALGGGHWSAAAWRRSSWAGDVFSLEHYDPSGDVEINADAAGLFGAALAERISELCAGGAELERTEIWRMASPAQHDPAVCGLTSVAFLQALFAAHCADRAAKEGASGGAAAGGGSVGGGKGRARAGPPRSPAQLLRVGWEEVEALRRAAAAAHAPHLLPEVARYSEALRALGRRAVGTVCSQRCEVVFDVYGDEDLDAFEGADSGSGADDPRPNVVARPDVLGAGFDFGSTRSEFGAFLESVGVGAPSQRLLCRSTTLERCVALCLADRPAFLRTLKQLGLSRLADRQALANAIGRAVREGVVSGEGRLQRVGGGAATGDGGARSGLPAVPAR